MPTYSATAAGDSPKYRTPLYYRVVPAQCPAAFIINSIFLNETENGIEVPLSVSDENARNNFHTKNFLAILWSAL